MSRRRAFLAWLATASLSACGSGGSGDLGPRAREIIDTLTAADADLLRDRPRLVSAKYALMASDAFAFFRGSLALFLADWEDSRGALQATLYPASALPLGLGDAHPENFGLLRDQAGNFRLEPNDFDTADRVPYLWDVRRFAVGMCLAARLGNATDGTARATTAGATRDIVRAAVASYADTIRGIVGGGRAPVIQDGGGNALLEDLFTRAAEAWESHTELDQLSVVKGGVRGLVRGAPDPDEPDDMTRDLPARSDLDLARTVATYRDTLTVPPPVPALAALDAVQELGRGVGSLPRVRALVLTRGPTTGTDDDVILEVKELPPQDRLLLPAGPSAFATPQARLSAALSAGLSEPGADPLWGVGTWAGFPVQVRTEAAGFKTVRVHRVEGALGTPDAVKGLGVALASLIARMHAAPVAGTSAAGAIGAAIAADPDGFVEEQSGVALGYCDQVLADWRSFQQALGALGPTLGAAGNPGAVASAELRALFDPGSHPDTVEKDPVVGPLALDELCAVAPDFVELLNTSASSQPIGGYAIADADSDGGPRFEKARAFPSGATLAAGARVVVAGGFAQPAPDAQADCGAPLGPCYQAAWEISGDHGEAMFVLSPDGVIVDRAVYPPDIAMAGQSWSRLPDGDGPFSVGAATPGAINTGL